MIVGAAAKSPSDLVVSSEFMAQSMVLQELHSGELRELNVHVPHSKRGV